MSEAERLREIVHKFNNLLGVIYTQAAVARSEDSVEGLRGIIEVIESAAKQAAEVVQRAR